MDKEQTQKEASRQIAELIEAGTEEDKQAIERERREGHGRRLRKEAEEL